VSHELSPKAKAFIEAIVALEWQHGLSLGHEDPEGAFLVQDLSQDNVNWLRAAFDESNDPS